MARAIANAIAHRMRIAMPPSRPLKEIPTHLPAPNPRSAFGSSEETFVVVRPFRTARETDGQRT
jgi:hypothetical protein